MQLALHGANRVRSGETPELKNPSNLSKLHGEQNIDFFESSLKELQARDNADGDVSIHIFTAGPDEDAAAGKVKVGKLEAEVDGNAKEGTRFSVETFGDVKKIKSHRFEESKVVAFEATVRPGNELTSSVLILDRENPEESVIAKASSNWLLFG